MYQLYNIYKNQAYNLYNTYKDRDFIFIIPFVLLAFCRIGWHFFQLLYSARGFPKCDDSTWYIDYANALMLNLTNGLDMNDVLYLGYNVLLTLLLAVFKDPIAIIVIQGIVASLSVILVFKIAKMLFNKATAVIASLFYAISYDISLWSMYILSDSFFVSLLLLCVYFLLMALESNQKIYKILFAITALYMLIFRPTGIITLFFILVYAVIRLRKRVLQFLYNHRLKIGCFFTFIIAASIYLYVDNKLDTLIQSLQFNAKKVLYNIYAKGWIYDRPTPYDYFFRPNYAINVYDSLILSFIVNNWEHVSILYGRRALSFLGKWVWEIDWQSVSGIIKFVKLSLPTALFLIGSIFAVRNGLFRKASIVWLIILSVFAFCTFIFIDSMYRYKFPAVPFIAIVAAYGTERIVHRARIIAKKSMEMLSYGQRKNTDCNTGL